MTCLLWSLWITKARAALWIAAGPRCESLRWWSRCSVVSSSLGPPGLQPARLLCPWDSPGKNPGVGCRFLLQGIFLTQESNPGLLHCRQIPYRLSCEGSPKIRYEFWILLLFMKLNWKLFSPVWIFATPWIIQSMEFSGPENWVGSRSLLQGIFPTQRSNPVSHIADRFFTNWATREAW